MVNSIQSKMMKMKRRNRHAVFSGETSKYAVRVDTGKYKDVRIINEGLPNEDRIPTGKHVVIPVGPVSLSKAVINTGRGPDKERMQEYYSRVPDYSKELPITLGLTVPMQELKDNYERIVRGNTNIHRVVLVDDPLGKLDLLFIDRQFMFVETDIQRRRMRKSIIYSNRRIAMAVLEAKAITWVEVLPTVVHQVRPPAQPPST